MVAMQKWMVGQRVLAEAGGEGFTGVVANVPDPTYYLLRDGAEEFRAMPNDILGTAPDDDSPAALERWLDEVTE